MTFHGIEFIYFFKQNFFFNISLRHKKNIIIMIEIKGKYCKDIKVFTDNIEEEALASLYRISESLAFKDKKIRVMPDVHQGKGNAVIGFSCPNFLDIK